MISRRPDLAPHIRTRSRNSPAQDGAEVRFGDVSMKHVTPDLDPRERTSQAAQKKVPHARQG
jgi:hypothetical protein